MKTPAFASAAYPCRQRGAALIVAMILLMIMSLLTVTSMRTGIQEERMASASYDRNLAFQAAEAALRAGEAQAENWAQGNISGAPTIDDSLPLPGTGDTCDSNNNDEQVAGSGLYSYPDRDCDKARWENEDVSWHELNSTDDSDAAGIDGAGALSLKPSYIVELLAIGAPCNPSNTDPDADQNNKCMRFRVTAKSSSEGGRAHVMLQSTYATDGVPAAAAGP
jgi:type IV pilus assembly protein PilX